MEKETEAALRLLIKDLRGMVNKLSENPSGINKVDEYALNEAGWTFIDSYEKLYHQVIPTALFKYNKKILRVCIAKYLECEGKDPNER